MLFYPTPKHDQNDLAIIADDCYQLRRVSQPITHVLDVGARDGTFSVLARCLFPDARVLAVDADQAAAERLSSTVGRWGIDVLHAAVADGGIYRFVDRGPCSYLVRDPDGQPTLCLVPLTDWYRCERRTTLLKVDTEGAEGCLTAGELMSFGEFRIELHVNHSKSAFYRSIDYWADVAQRINQSADHWCELGDITELTINCHNVEQITVGHGYLVGGRH